ncbi:structural maintenance of chromosomes protein 3-like [Aphidius gifuensis]|uniref:structural maintenance of chromosomes protein 3-like n=1 Tax=Aphidius gifuensis TaxID=684658 RepID=UPI001CDC5EAB|nr:structural maintenance of chromosomes protein 3-like [Aphidius gifuensis]
MHIKKLSICGFKSFQHLTVVDDLSKGHNAIVGKNGSGKSNLFHAIEFLFGEEYARLSAQRRQGLMHQGNGKTLSAFVEITFDNSDKKFPNKSDSIIIRREISNVKEVYYLNSKEIRKIQQIAIGNDKQRLDLLREISGVKYFDEQLQSWHKNLQKKEDKLKDVDNELKSVEEQNNGLIDEKNELNKITESLDMEIADLEDEITHKQQEIEKKLKFSILQGIKSVEKIYNDENIDGYHGTVADNISCDDNLYRAVSTVAKNRLFHHIVDTETIGIEILEKMKDKNLSGDVTFLPVNRVHSKYINYPTNKDCCPLVSKITCSDEQFDKIIGSIFGKTLVVRNIDTALNLETNLNCVTLSGDQVFSDGTMFGGFTNAQSNLELYYDYQKICEEYKQYILKDLENQVRSLIIDKKNKEKNIEDCLKNINDMGPLPNDKARSIFDDWSTNKIFEELTRVNIELEKLGNINNNFSNYEDYISKREWIIQRHGDAQERNIIIRNTIEELGLQKKEESAAMFKQINDNFVNIFKELVPDGQAKLVMLSGGNNNDQDDFDPDELVGIGISVSFDKKNCQMENLKKFSGGQKSIVALALIFAIQSYNPAPFYLFDEIDQALDPEYRKTVAKMIQKMSKNAQFITTTFRTELLQNAQKFYGVQCQNKISRVITVSKAEAINFIDEDLADK